MKGKLFAHNRKFVILLISCYWLEKEAITNGEEEAEEKT